MQSTFGKFSASFKGKYGAAGIPALVENGGIRTVGGFISGDNVESDATKMKYVGGEQYPVNTPLFGVPLFAKASAPSEMFVGNGGVSTNVIAGSSANMIFRGFLLNRPMVNEQLPGHSIRLIGNQPCDAVYQGAIWLYVQPVGSGAVEVGDNIFVDAAGNIYAKTSAMTANSTTQVAVSNAKIIEKHSEVDGLYLVMLS